MSSSRNLDCHWAWLPSSILPCSLAGGGETGSGWWETVLDPELLDPHALESGLSLLHSLPELKHLCKYTHCGCQLRTRTFSPGTDQWVWRYHTLSIQPSICLTASSVKRNTNHATQQWEEWCCCNICSLSSIIWAYRKTTKFSTMPRFALMVHNLALVLLIMPGVFTCPEEDRNPRTAHSTGKETVGNSATWRVFAFR